MGAARQNTANLLDVRSYHFMAAAFKAEVVQSYRSISKQALRTICYAAPARYTLRAVINNAYRFGNAADFDQRKIDKTLDFLRYAAAENALEHHIVKTLIHTWFHDGDIKRVHSIPKPGSTQHKQMKLPAFQHFEVTVKMFNESFGTCLPTSIHATRSPIKEPGE